MSISATHIAPSQVTAGDTIDFLVAIPAALAGWTGSARLVGPSTMDAASCATEGSDFHVKFPGQGSAGTNVYKTALLTPGFYTLIVFASQDLDRQTVAKFPIAVGADLSVGTPQQAYPVRMLALVQAERERRITGGAIVDYTVDNTHVLKATDAELRSMEREFSATVAQLNNPNGQLPRVNFAFAPTGGMMDLRKRFR